MLGLSLGLGLTSRGGTGGDPWLANLSLSASTVSEDAEADTVIGTVIGTSTGSTLELTGDAGGLLALDGLELKTAGALDYEDAQSLPWEITETLAGATNTPRISEGEVEVTNVLEVTLVALSLDDDEIEEGSVATDVVGTLSGATSGSTLSLTLNPGGLFDLDGNDLIVTGDPGAVDTEYNINVRETHADATNSPSDNPFTITVVSAEPVEGNELWVQPAFDASTGVSLLGSYAPARPTISGGKLNGFTKDDGEEGVTGGDARATALETLAAGTYRVVYTIDSIGTMAVRVYVGGNTAAHQTTLRSTAGTFSEDITIPSADNQFITMNFGGNTDNQTAVVDNFSVKQLT